MIANALGPVFLLILLGALLRRLNFPGAQIWPGIERLTYYVAFPALLVNRLALADFGSTRLGVFVAVIGAALLILSALIWLLKPWLARNNPDFTSVFQGGIRFNTYIGLAIASALFGDAGLAIAAVAIGIMVPIVNLCCVCTLAMADDRQRLQPPQLAHSLLTNPLILACLAGMTLNLTGIGLPGWSAELTARLGAAALPLGLLAVGVGLSLASVRHEWREIGLASALKFGVLPALLVGLGIVAGLDALSLQVLLLLGCLPTASSAYILARQMGGNAQLMAGIISLQTLLGFALIPLWLTAGSWLLGS